MQTRQREYWLDKPETFYAYVIGQFEHVDGWPVCIDGWGELDVFVTYENYPETGEVGYVTICGVTGTRFLSKRGLRLDSPQEAVAEAAGWLHNYYGTDREKFMQDRERNLEKYGLSPRYRWEEVSDAD